MNRPNRPSRRQLGHGERVRRSSTGFTLLEVLASVAILGVLYSVLATGAIRSLRAEGENERRVRAGLIADRVLSELEDRLRSEPTFEHDEEEVEEEEFIILTEILPFGSAEEGAVEPVAALPSATLDATTDLASAIAIEAPDLLELLVGVRVTVTWVEGFGERSVVRNSFAFNQAEGLLAFPPPEGGPGGGAGDGFPGFIGGPNQGVRLPQDQIPVDDGRNTR